MKPTFSTYGPSQIVKPERVSQGVCLAELFNLAAAECIYFGEVDAKSVRGMRCVILLSKNPDSYFQP